MYMFDPNLVGIYTVSKRHPIEAVTKKRYLAHVWTRCCRFGGSGGNTRRNKTNSGSRLYIGL